jgi:hypothetical protein
LRVRSKTIAARGQGSNNSAPPIRNPKSAIRNRRFITPAILLVSMLLTVTGCPKPAAKTNAQNQKEQFRQHELGEALLKTAASQLNDLPKAVDTELRPPEVILDSRKSADGKDVFATCSATPQAPEVFNVIRVPANNSRFRSLGVKAGYRVKYYVKEDETVDADSRNAGFSRQLALELTIAQVLDDNTLLLETGLNQPVEVPRKIEVWRYVENRLVDIHEKLQQYEVFRSPPIAWEPAADETVLTQVIDFLNQWSRQSDRKTDWKRTPLLDSLGADLKSNKELTPYISAAGLANRGFQQGDGQLLQEAVWTRDISRWAHGDGFDDLSRATALFDLTVRNVELEPDGSSEAHRPWHTLLYARGTADERAWVFALLCRQQGLDVVLLYVPEAKGSGDKAASEAATNFWLPALLSDGKLYLFDVRLGLPIPGPGGKGVATLEDVRKDDKLLRQLDLDGAAYPITAESLKNVEVQLVADPFSLSRRARQMESELSGDDRLALTAKPDDIATKLKPIPGISNIRLWDVPFKTLLNQLTLGKSARHAAAIAFEPFAKTPALWKARTRQFQGRREGNANRNDALADVLDDHREANALYLGKAVRPTDKEIAASANENKQRVDSMAKLSAAYFIGLMSFDDGKHAVAATWFSKPELNSEGSPWKFGAAYNLARASQNAQSAGQGEKVGPAGQVRPLIDFATCRGPTRLAGPTCSTFFGSAGFSSC